jgi:hypothetical protein
LDGACMPRFCAPVRAPWPILRHGRVLLPSILTHFFCE